MGKSPEYTREEIEEWARRSSYVDWEERDGLDQSHLGQPQEKIEPSTPQSQPQVSSKLPG